MKEKILSLVEVAHKDGERLRGRVMPSSTEEILVLKLSSGYNIGINRANIITIRPLQEDQREQKTLSKKPEPMIHQAYLLPMSILHTGGTVASKVDYETGAVNASFTPKELLAKFPELKDIANIKSRLIRNMWSQDMRFEHYNLIAKEIKKEIDQGAHGIIVTHGTDTLCYTAAALAFILEDVPIPVLLVGSQRSSDRGSSDAALNLICAAQFITRSNFAGVAICMHTSMNDDYCTLLPACKTRKMHTSRRDAFKAINGHPIALIDKHGNLEMKTHEYQKREQRILKLKLFNEKIKVGVLYQRTHMFAEEFLSYKDYDGLVIESTGLGNLPVTEIDEYTREHKRIFNALKKMIQDGTMIVLSPQTLFGRLNMNVYENGRRQLEMGILGNFSDMLTEVTYLKLAWLLSNYRKEEVKKMMGENLRGELSKRITPDEFV